MVTIKEEMKMKLFRILMALALVFALVVPAAMAEDEADVCEPCTAKCSPKDIGCASGDQFGSTCPEGDDYEIPPLLADGSPDVLGTWSDCPVIIDICECDVIESGAVALTAGTDVTLKFTILVNGQAGVPGAYFAEGFTGRVVMSNSRAFLCEPTPCATPLVLTTASVTPGDTTISYWCDRDNDGTFDLLNEVNNTGDIIWRADAFNTWAMSALCPTGVNNTSAFITPNSIDIENVDYNLKMSHMAVDIPAIMITPAITECSTISIRVDVFIGAGVSICPTDDAQCSCVFDLYKACCSMYSNTLTFPYFTSLSAASYWNGIVITNVGTTSGTATLNAYEQDGSTATFTTPEIAGRGMYVNLLENISWSGSGLGDSRCWIRVTTTFNADGFAMLSNDVHDSMGYLPRLSGM